MASISRRSANSLNDVMDWFESVSPVRMGWSDVFIPVEEFVEDGRHVVRADIPGVDPEKDLTVTVEDGYLVIHGERREEQHDQHRSEVRHGSFSRRIALPRGCTGEDVKATYAQGVLTVSLPVDGETPEPLKIPIARSGD